MELPAGLVSPIAADLISAYEGNIMKVLVRWRVR